MPVFVTGIFYARRKQVRYYSVVSDADVCCGFVAEKKENCCLISFEDKDKDKIFGLLRAQFFKDNPQYVLDKGILSRFGVNVVDENGDAYTLALSDGTYVRTGKCSLSRFRKMFALHDSLLSRRKEKSALIKSRYAEDTVEYERSLIPRYASFRYFDAETGTEIPCRFSKGRREGTKPLFIYLHGAGASGTDNFKQLAEYKTVGINLKEDCFVLLPQYGGFTGENLKDIMTYTAALKRLVQTLARTYPLDKDRIYVTGISFGGACTWYSLYNNPGFYAAAIPLMGYMPDVYSDFFDKNRFKDEKIWAAHASDDNVVPIDGDELLYGKIKDVCAIKFSVYEKGGHKTTRKFYISEDWQKWMFAQKKQKSERIISETE